MLEGEVKGLKELVADFASWKADIVVEVAKHDQKLGLLEDAATDLKKQTAANAAHTHTDTSTTVTTQTTVTATSITTTISSTTTTTTPDPRWSTEPHNDKHLMLFLPCDGDVKDKSCAKGTGPCKSHEINTQGSAGWTAGQAKFGKGSCDLTKGFLKLPASNHFLFSDSKDYTIEMWLRWPNIHDWTCQGTCAYDRDDKVFDGGGKHRWGFKPLGSGLKMGGEAIGAGCGAMWSEELKIANNEWHFFVWMRKDNVAYLGMNGKWYMEMDNSCELDPIAGSIGIGGTPGHGGERVPAYFDELRISKDVARFEVKDQKFTVPTKPYCGGYKNKC